MTWLALVLDVCAMLGIAEPAAFYALPDATQDLWVDHARNLRSGAYETRKKAPPRTHAENMAAQREAIEAARKREART
jgi:hypothetical protein